MCGTHGSTDWQRSGSLFSPSSLSHECCCWLHCTWVTRLHGSPVCKKSLCRAHHDWYLLLVTRQLETPC
jgi:hypothetical protein